MVVIGHYFAYPFERACPSYSACCSDFGCLETGCFETVVAVRFHDCFDDGCIVVGDRF